MLDDEPTTHDSTPADGTPAATPGETPGETPAAAPRRRRATKATAAPAASPAAEADGGAPPAAAPTAGDQAGDEPAPAKKAPAKRAPAKKAAAKKAPAKKATAAENAAENAAETPDSAGAAAAPVDAPASADTAAGAPSPHADAPAEAAAGDDGAPRTRTRRRASVAVAFQPPPAPDLDVPTDLDEELDEDALAAAASALAAADGAPADSPVGSDDADGPAPRRRRRAGTSGAIAPATFLAPAPAPERSDADDLADMADLDDRGETEGDDADGEDGDRPRSRRRRGRRGRGRPLDGEAGTEGRDDSDTDRDDETDRDGAASGRQPAGRSRSRGGADDAGQGGGQGQGAGQGAGSGQGPDSSDDEDEDAAATRRRRRRRRSGAGGGADTGGSDDPPGTVVHVREPQARQQRVRGASAADEDGVRGITGSTRMAAKRARRQEGRDSGRRRPPILTEAEFLARREAVDRTMIVRQKGDRTQIAVLEDGVLVEHYVTKASAQSFAGNVYLGRVQNVLPSMEAAFIDVGKGRNAVLYAGEVNYELLGAGGGGGGRKIEQVLKSGQEVLVQVTKDPMGHKGARLTSQISLPGRYLVYVPEGSMTGISRKLPENERTRLKSILKKIVPDDAGVIIRTAAEGVGEEEIERDVRRLQAQWDVIQTNAKKGGAPVLLHAEPDLVVKVVRDVFNEDFTSLVVQGESEWDTIKDYVEFVAPDLAPRLSRWEGDRDVFAAHRVDEQIAKGLERKVWLPSGGSLVIDRTEAMVVIDVNTGKYVGKGGNLEETVTRNNLEAAEEVARQLRLRDLGGIIVVDFIDMVLESNRDLVVRRLVECLGRDRTKHQVAEVTSLGLVQMTRKRVGQGLLESFSENCEHCSGRGYLTHAEPIDRKESTERFDDRAGSEQAGRGRRDRGGSGGGTGSGSGGSGGSGSGDRAPKAAAPVRPTDGGAGLAAVAAASSRRNAATPDPAETDAVAMTDDAVQADADVPTGPKRRRRGGRSAGAGQAVVDPMAELQELEAGPTAEAADQEALDAVLDPAVDLQAAGDTDESLADELADAELAAADPAVAEPEAELVRQPVVADAEPQPEPEVRPRRRRATSRPAGPPTSG